MEQWSNGTPGKWWNQLLSWKHWTERDRRKQGTFLHPQRMLSSRNLNWWRLKLETCPTYTPNSKSLWVTSSQGLKSQLIYRIRNQMSGSISLDFRAKIIHSSRGKLIINNNSRVSLKIKFTLQQEASPIYFLLLSWELSLNLKIHAPVSWCSVYITIHAPGMYMWLQSLRQMREKAWLIGAFHVK